MKKAVILFPDQHLAYSPTVIQLYDILSKYYSVTIIAPIPEYFNNRRLDNRNVVYYNSKGVFGAIRYIYRISFEILTRISGGKKFRRQYGSNYNYYFFTYKFLKRQLLKNKYDKIIAVDLKSLWICASLELKSDFLSLELPADKSILNDINIEFIQTVLTQTPERYEYLFGARKIDTFYIQNAPNFREIDIPATRSSLLYNGTAWDLFGFYHCLDFLNKFSGEKLTVIGALRAAAKMKIDTEYSHLIAEERLNIDANYYDNDELLNVIVKYEIGFCFYDFDHPAINTFNYQTAPSGKLFKYLAAGIPVIANDIPGFRFVKEFQCGVLINNLDPDEIHTAVIKIRGNYAMFVQNALAAARHFSFDKSIKPYIEKLVLEQK